MVGKNLNTPNLSPMAGNVIARGGIQGLGSPLYTCGMCCVFLSIECQDVVLEDFNMQKLETEKMHFGKT